MKYSNSIKRNSWLILAVLALVGMILVPSQAHSQPVGKIYLIPTLRLPSAAREIAPAPRLPSPLAARKTGVVRLPSLLRPSRPIIVAEPAEARSALADLKKLKKVFDNIDVRQSVRLNLPEDELEASLGL